MDHFREIKNNLKWHNEGKFEVELVNGIITKLNFCEPGKGPEDTGKCLNSINFKFLQAVYSSLGDLFVFIDEENKRLGYSYAQETETYQKQDNTAQLNIYPLLGEIKLKQVEEYKDQPEINSILKNIDLIRDAV